MEITCVKTYFTKRGGYDPMKRSLTPPLFIDVSVPRQVSEGSCICVLGVSVLSLATIFRLDFRIVQTFYSFHYQVIIE
jgi:hypothetical protein